MKHSRAFLVASALAVCVGCDHATKLAATAWLEPARALPVAAETVRFELAHDPGAFPSLGASLPARLRVRFASPTGASPPLHDLGLVAATFSPLFLGLIFHGVCIKLGWLGRIAVPLDRGARLRGQPLFGPNKTYRGVVAVALGSAAGYTLQGAFPSLQAPGLRSLSFPLLPCFGFVLGATSMLSELPNSLLKRQLGVDSGAPGGGWLAPVFYVLDQVDFLLGAWLVVWPWVSPSWSRVLWSAGFVLVVHQTISAIGAGLGMRSSAR